MASTPPAGDGITLLLVLWTVRALRALQGTWYRVVRRLRREGQA